MNDAGGWVLACGLEVPDSFTLAELARHAETCEPCTRTLREMKKLDREAEDLGRRNGD